MTTQVFYHYTLLEEHQAGLWRTTRPGEREALTIAAYRLMRNPARFLEAMLRACKEWPYSMEAAMTTPSLNQRAWMGHSGCCIAVGSPEDLTRLAWHRLNQKQQDAANAAADSAIEFWANHTRIEALPDTSIWDA